MPRITPPELLFLFSLSLLSLESSAFHLEEPQSEPPNFMKEYMTRGMFQCTTQYMNTIHEIQKLIKKAYLEHMKCQEEMREADKTYPKEDNDIFDALNDLQDRFREEDEEASSLPPASTTTETPLSRRKRTHRPTH